MVLDVVPDSADPQAVVGLVAVHLAEAGSAGLPQALTVLVEALGLRSAVLRGAGRDQELLAVAGDVVQAVTRPRRDRSSVVELPVRGPSAAGSAVLTVVGARPAALPVLRSVCAVLGLALAAGAPAHGAAQDVPTQDVPTLDAPTVDALAPPAALPGAALDGGVPGPGEPAAAAGPALLLDAETAWGEVADALHDGPLQDLVAARYAADTASRTGDLSPVRDAVQAALVTLRRRLWQLRPRGADGLAPALRALSARLVEAGASALTLDLQEEADVLPPVAAVAAYRLVQAASRAGAPLTVTLHRRPEGRACVVVLSVDGAGRLADADRWRRTAAALGGALVVRAGAVRLTLPVPCPTPLPAVAGARASNGKARL